MQIIPLYCEFDIKCNWFSQNGNIDNYEQLYSDLQNKLKDIQFNSYCFATVTLQPSSPDVQKIHQSNISIYINPTFPCLVLSNKTFFSSDNISTKWLMYTIGISSAGYFICHVLDDRMDLIWFDVGKLCFALIGGLALFSSYQKGPLIMLLKSFDFWFLTLNTAIYLICSYISVFHTYSLSRVIFLFFLAVVKFYVITTFTAIDSSTLNRTHRSILMTGIFVFFLMNYIMIRALSDNHYRYNEVNIGFWQIETNGRLTILRTLGNLTLFFGAYVFKIVFLKKDYVILKFPAKRCSNQITFHIPMAKSPLLEASLETIENTLLIILTNGPLDSYVDVHVTVTFSGINESISYKKTNQIVLNPHQMYYNLSSKPLIPSEKMSLFVSKNIGAAFYIIVIIVAGISFFSPSAYTTLIRALMFLIIVLTSWSRYHIGPLKFVMKEFEFWYVVFNMVIYMLLFIYVDKMLDVNWGLNVFTSIIEIMCALPCIVVGVIGVDALEMNRNRKVFILMIIFVAYTTLYIRVRFHQIFMNNNASAMLLKDNPLWIFYGSTGDIILQGLGNILAFIARFLWNIIVMRREFILISFNATKFELFIE